MQQQKNNLTTMSQRENPAPGTILSKLSDTAAVLSRSLEGTKNVTVLSHCCSESTKESIAGWGTFGLEARLDLLQNYEIWYGYSYE